MILIFYLFFFFALKCHKETFQVFKKIKKTKTKKNQKTQHNTMHCFTSDEFAFSDIKNAELQNSQSSLN